MAKANVKVDLKDAIKKLDKMTPKGQYALINQVHADMNPYVPAKSYDLRNQSSMTLDMKSIIYNVPYASWQFYNQFSNYTTPGTGPRWDNKAKSIHGKSWERIVEKAMK